MPWSQHSADEVDADGRLLNEETLTLRRAFFRAIAERDRYFAELELDGNTVDGPAARIVTSQVGWHYDDHVRVRGGLLLIPFGSYAPTNARDRFFMEQPTFIRALFPGDVDGGVNAEGQYGLVRWSVAMMNGAPVADAQWGGKDPASSFDVMGRLGADVPLPYRARVVIGVSAVTGKGLHAGRPPTKDSFQWVDANQDGIVQTSELSVVPGSPGEPSRSFSRDAVDVDAAIHWCICALGRGRLRFEGAIAKNLDRGVIYADPIARARDVRELGFAIDLVQELGSYALAGVRYDRYDADRDAAETEGVATVYTHEVFTTWSMMAAAHVGTSRLSIQYDHVTNPFGRSDGGAPTTERADRITLRGQVEF